MTAFALKLIAIIAMTCDHIGASILVGNDWLFLRAIGRLTMPIMAYFAAVGFRKTKNIGRYLLRLIIFAIISELPYYLVFGTHGNVIITIFLGVFALYLGEIASKKSKVLQISIWLIFAIIAFFAQTDWSFTGVLLIIAFYLANGNKIKSVLYPLPVYALYMTTFLGNGTHYFVFNMIQLWGLMSLPLLCLYNGRKGCNAKYLFYVYYPLHLAMIYIAKLLL